MFGLVLRSTMDAAIARERELAVDATAAGFEYYKASQVAEERARTWEKRARRAIRRADQWNRWYHDAERQCTGLRDRLERIREEQLAARAAPTPATPSLEQLNARAVETMSPPPKPKPAAASIPFVLAEQVRGWDEAWAREDVHELLDEARVQAGGDWNAVLGPATDPTAGIVTP